MGVQALIPQVPTGSVQSSRSIAAATFVCYLTQARKHVAPVLAHQSIAHFLATLKVRLNDHTVLLRFHSSLAQDRLAHSGSPSRLITRWYISSTGTYHMVMVSVQLCSVICSSSSCLGKPSQPFFQYKDVS